MPLRILATVAAGVAALALAPAAGAAVAKPLVRTWTIHYRDHSGARQRAFVVLPAWYGPRRHPRIPLIISPHGRGLTGRENARIWRALPARGGFAVVNPDGVSRYSWGAAGQIADLARMPTILHLTLPWLKLDHSRIYAFGGSMGGQETLLLVARHPRLLAGAAAFDAVADFARQYRNWPSLHCSGPCLRSWKGPIGVGLQSLARRQLGGSPKTAPVRYALRSPLTFSRRIATSCVPLQLWWSVADRIVPQQQLQSGRLFWSLRKQNPAAPVAAFVGTWIHSSEMRADAQLPTALAYFGLLPAAAGAELRVRHVPEPAEAADCRGR